jgi:hypothetical protein
MMKACPKVLDSGSVKIRATMSVALPPAPATMTLTGLVGQFSAFCAKTEFEKKSKKYSQYPKISHDVSRKVDDENNEFRPHSERTT